MPAQRDFYDLIVVGGGIVGLATAYQLQVREPSLRILLLEKADHLAAHQSGHNSGVIHSGLYYKPGSSKAQNCVKGRKALVEFAQTHGIAHEICGKVVVATHESELPHAERIFQNGLANGIEGITKIDGRQVRDIEPHCTAAISGIWVPCAGIIHYPEVAAKLAGLFLQINPHSKLLTGQAVRLIRSLPEGKEVLTGNHTFRSKQLICCAGLHADRLASMDGLRPQARIVGFRGDYYELSPAGCSKVRNLIYPIPNPAFPFLGVHFTRMIRGGVECGPNAVFTFKREGYGKTDFNLRDSWEALTYAGTWRLFARHWKFGLNEYRRAFSKKLFHTQLKRLIPSIGYEELLPGRSGVRAMALLPDGSMLDDFHIESTPHSIHVLNAPSPAATACLAIGEQICDMALKQFAR
ncbi:MAG: L-2-hydroxyglutarate oxidase [Bacteroidetes bacterium]|nr:MAG: L-2-hydroxyglutarate oxidase [Bacteroidota bacterium]